jgi:DNA replicative helicase MCM subunit Mcm2 (Cdc46/Mcm family)
LLTIDLEDLKSYSESLAGLLVSNPTPLIPLLETALQEHARDFESYTGEIQLGIYFVRAKP